MERAVDISMITCNPPGTTCLADDDGFVVLNLQTWIFWGGSPPFLSIQTFIENHNVPVTLKSPPGHKDDRCKTNDDLYKNRA